MDVAKTADGTTVLARVSWGYHDAIGCYLTLDDTALAALRASPAPQSLPDTETDASKRCFLHHNFGQKPVDVAKTADGQTVLARLSWDHHDSIGCYLTLDNTALTTLRTTTETTDPDDTTDPDGETTDPDDTGIVAAANHHSIAVGGSHSCAIRADQTIACWGDNLHGQTNAPAGRYSAIAASQEHSCAIRADETVACWGSTWPGRLVAPSGRYTAIAAGNFHYCAINTDQAIVCWGRNSIGQADAPAGRYTAIAAGGDHSCAIKADQTIACWGNNTFGQSNAPAGRYTAIAGSGEHACAIKADQTIACWGRNRVSLRDVPGYPPGRSVFGGQADAPAGRYTAVAAAGGGNVEGGHSCAVRTDGAIACWGSNLSGQADAPAGGYTAISAGGNKSCAVRADGAIACWGHGGDFVLETTEPRTGEDQDQYSAVAAGDWHTCAIRADQTIACWGSTYSRIRSAPSGQFTAAAAGDFSCGIKTDQTIACWVARGVFESLAPQAGRYTAVATGYAHSCGIGTDQMIYCGGANYSGQGDAPLGQYTAVAARSYYTCGIKTDETLACWGDNRYGQTDPPAGRYTHISTGTYHSCAIRTDQTIACWGNNKYGQSDPPAGQYTAVAAGGDHSCAIRTDQTIACWGTAHDFPQSGKYSAISAGMRHSCAIRTDQTIACWGDNTFEQTDITPTRPQTHRDAANSTTGSDNWWTRLPGAFVDRWTEPDRWLRWPTGLLRVKYHVCTTPELAPSVPAQFINDMVAALNEREAPYYSWQSSGMLNVRFEAGQVLEIPYDEAAIRNNFNFDNIVVSPGCLDQTNGVVYDPRVGLLVNHFFEYGTANANFDSADGKASLYSQISATYYKNLPSESPRLPQDWTRGLMKNRWLDTAAHELDHNLGIDHIPSDLSERPEHGPTRIPPGIGYGLDLGQLPDDRAFDEVYTCFDMLLLGWPAGEDHPSCVRAAPPSPPVECIGDLVTGEECRIVRWTLPSLRNPEPITSYAISIWKGTFDESMLVSEHEVSAISTQFQLPKLQPGEYYLSIGAKWAGGIGNFASTTNIGPRSYAIFTVTTPPERPASEYTAIAAAVEQSCAIRTDGAINCWGSNYYFGQADPPEGQYTAISASRGRACAIKTDQTINCWGSDAHAPEGTYTAVSASVWQSCAIKTDQTIACWGDNDYGQLSAPAGQHTAIASGGVHVCAIRADQTINCWGGNRYGQTDAPAGRYTAISAGSHHSCAIRADQTINCWGRNRYGQSDPPAGQYTAISSGGDLSCAIKTDQTISCWGGENSYGELDAPAGQYTAISAGGGHACAIKADQTISCWGANQYGQGTPP